MIEMFSWRKYKGVVAAADALYGVIAEFPDDPAVWQEHIDSLDKALEYCPGTAAHYHITHSNDGNSNE